MNNSFGFLVHSRNTTDLKRKFKVLNYLPDIFAQWLAKNLPPITVSKITGLKNKSGVSVTGYIIGITMTARQMIEDRKLALKKIIKACQFAERKGVKIIGLGALTASLSKGGLDIIPHLKELNITTGRAYTTKTVTDYVKTCVTEFGFDKEKVKIGIVGAGGSIGSNCAKILVTWGIKNIILIDLPKRYEVLKSQLHALQARSSDLNINTTHAINNIKECDIIITATNAPEALLHDDDISPGTIIINDAQPSDVPVGVIKNRKDILVIEGGIIHTPGIKCNFNLGLAHREDTFCCLGEVYILAKNEVYDAFSKGELEEHLIEEIEKMAIGMDIFISKFQNDIQGYIPEEQIANVRKIISSKILEHKS